MIRTIKGADQEMRDIMTRLWGSSRIALNGVIYDLTEADALICEDEKGLMGFLHYISRGDEWEVLSLDCPRPGVGAGSALIAEVVRMARSSGAKRLVVVTTNDNTDAMRFYQRRGFALVDVRFDAVTRSREIKPEIPPLGEGGIPIRHEMVFGMEL